MQQHLMQSIDNRQSFTMQSVTHIVIDLNFKTYEMTSHYSQFFRASAFCEREVKNQIDPNRTINQIQ
jgi:hypothetical protein